MRTIAFGKEQQPARRFEVERFAAAAERADHHRTARGKRLLGRPERLIAFGAANDDQLLGIEAVLRETNRVRRAILGKHALFACPDHAGSAGPGSR
jgi:hypothetical protein